MNSLKFLTQQAKTRMAVPKSLLCLAAEARRRKRQTIDVHILRHASENVRRGGIRKKYIGYGMTQDKPDAQRD